MPVINDAQVEAYRRDGFIIVEDLVPPPDLSAMRQVIAELVAGAAAVDEHTAVYDLEPGHTRADPKSDASRRRTRCMTSSTHWCAARR
jgi:phytanoyl-CoA hydroxylase